MVSHYVVFSVDLSIFQFMISNRQIKAARILLGWSQQDLADRALISRRSLTRIETASNEVKQHASTKLCVRRALEDAGIQFFHADGVAGEGVRVRLKGDKR